MSILNLTVADTRPMAVCFVDPTTGMAINPTSLAQEPFDPAKHLIALKPVPMQAASGVTLPSAFAALKFAQDNGVIESAPNAVIVFVSLDSTGAVQQVVDVWSNEAPQPAPLRGGWSQR